jgi:hypothetical protein
MQIERYDEPFEYFIIDNFLEEDVAHRLSKDFIDFESEDWYVYENPVEVKKALNSWYHFPPETYNFFHYLNSSIFVDSLCELTGNDDLYPDLGLHGGGWHIHGSGGKLNVHLDYSLHPKLNLQRKYNLILYLSPEWKQEWGGNLEFWSHNEETKTPKEKVATVECKFNRAVIFDASQNSWHGFNDPITCPEGHYRKSIASYYLTTPTSDVDVRQRALYSPTEEQKSNTEIMKFIESRAK